MNNSSTTISSSTTLDKFDDAMQIVCCECDTTNEQSEEKCENCPVRATYKRLLNATIKKKEEN